MNIFVWKCKSAQVGDYQDNVFAMH